MVARASARHVLDADCALFFNLLAAAVTTALGRARTLEAERQRTEALAEPDRAKTAFSSARARWHFLKRRHTGWPMTSRPMPAARQSQLPTSPTQQKTR
ncbi:hypothetical protein E4631_05165 [Hymenobacter sp. UV11]|nr:hypothetical protein A8B98_12015 [Hymenobacter sp. UV11]TFZ67377.1 hypothetical protein E4631_05165 [Hymenobacter sp. UV11]